MRFKNLSIIALLSLGTTVALAATPKNPQSAVPPSDVKKESEKSSATAEKAKTIALGNITTEVEGDLTIVTARLNKSPDWKDINLEEHGTFLQIKLPQTQIPSSGEFMDGNGPFLRKMATFQLPEEDGALRLFINQDASKAKLATTAELLGDRLVITIDHKKLEQLITPAVKTDAPSADEIISKTTVETEIPAPSQMLSSATDQSKSSLKTGEKSLDLHNQLTKAAGFCAALFLLFIGVHFFRTKKKRKAFTASANDHIQPATMKVLSSITLGQKQKLTLVQIGNQQVLLGVGPESINLITSIEPQSRSTNFANALQTANPNAEVRLKAPDEVTHSRAPRRALTASTPATSSNSRNESPTKGSRINVAIGEDGARNIAGNTIKKDDDITRLLRDRLRNLPPG